MTHEPQKKILAGLLGGERLTVTTHRKPIAS